MTRSREEFGARRRGCGPRGGRAAGCPCAGAKRRWENGGVTDFPQEFRGLTLAELRRAVAIYLRHAYGSAPQPEAVRRRLVWAESAGMPQVLERAPFEKLERGGSDGKCNVYALRL